MKNENIRKVNRIGNIGHIFTVLARIVLGIALVGCLVGTVAVSMIPKDLFQVKVNGEAEITVSKGVITEIIEKIEGNDAVHGSFNINGFDVEAPEITEDENYIYINGDVETQNFSLKSASSALICADIYLVLAFITMTFLGKLAKSFKTCDTPFTEDIIRSMNYFAYSLIPLAVSDSFTQAIGNGIMSAGNSFNFSVNMTMVMTILVVLGLVQVFKYGAKLQQESDETL